MARIPAREWHAAHGRRDTQAIAAALGFDRATLPDAWYALLPFVQLDTDDGPVIAGTDEPPLPFAEAPPGPLFYELDDGRTLDAGDAFAWLDTLGAAGDPQIVSAHVEFVHDRRIGPSDAAILITLDSQGTAAIHRERRVNHLFVPPADPEQHLRLFTSGRAFFRAWVAARIRWMQEARRARETYHMELPERRDGCLPGALLIGDARKVQWPADRTFICPDDATARAVNAGIMRAAHLSRAVVAQPVRRAA